MLNKILVHVSKELRQKINKRSMAVKKGDEVEVMRGKYKGTKGKVARVSHLKGKVYIEGITVKNARGTEVLVPIDPSNIQIINPVKGDKRKV